MAKGHKARGKTRAKQIQRRKDESLSGISALLGRDPSKGLVAFRTGTHLSEKNKLSTRSSKAASKEFKGACEHSEG